VSVHVYQNAPYQFLCVIAAGLIWIVTSLCFLF